MFANQRDIRCLLGSLGDKHPDMPAAAGNAVPPDRHADDRIHYVINRRFHSRGKILQLPLSNGAARLFWKLERRDAVATDACNNVSRSSSLDKARVSESYGNLLLRPLLRAEAGISRSCTLRTQLDVSNVAMKCPVRIRPSCVASRNAPSRQRMNVYLNLAAMQSRATRAFINTDARLRRDSIDRS